MGADSIHEINADGFSAEREDRGTLIHVRMRGNADMAVHEQLKKFLDSLDSRAQALGSKETVFELEELYFMNSSCLSLLLRFVNGILQAPAASRYSVRFRSNPNLRWQKKSLQAIRSYAQEIVSVE